MTNNTPKWEETKQEFDTFINVENDPNYPVGGACSAITDWWLSKLLERERELYQKMEEMKRDTTCYEGIEDNCNKPYIHTRDEFFNETLSKAQSLLALDEK